jgi:hypothetical protein
MSVESMKQENPSTEIKYKNRLIKIEIFWIKIRFKNINEI